MEALCKQSKPIGADFVYAWADAKVGMMEAELAAKIMYATFRRRSCRRLRRGRTSGQRYDSSRRGYVD